MVAFVVTCNFVIGLICLLVAWQLMRLRQRLAQASLTMNAVERYIRRIFGPAPRYILMGKTGTGVLRDRYQQLELQLAQIQQILGLLGIAQAFWLRQQRSRALRSAANSRRSKSWGSRI